ncbi:MAG: hypothetical protein ACRCYQ_01840 [Nocardioides sp.]
MTWLFGQLWFLMLIAFLIGTLVTFVVIKLALPHVNDLKAETGRTTKGVL